MPFRSSVRGFCPDASFVGVARVSSRMRMVSRGPCQRYTMIHYARCLSARLATFTLTGRSQHFIVFLAMFLGGHFRCPYHVNPFLDLRLWVFSTILPRQSPMPTSCHMIAKLAAMLFPGHGFLAWLIAGHIKY